MRKKNKINKYTPTLDLRLAQRIYLNHFYPHRGHHGSNTNNTNTTNNNNPEPRSGSFGMSSQLQGSRGKEGRQDRLAAGHSLVAHSQAGGSPGAQGSTAELTARTAGASRAGGRSGGRDHRAVGGRRRGRRGGSLARPEIFGRSDDGLGGIILKVGMLGELLGSVLQLQRRGRRAGRLGRAARRGRRFVPGRQFRSRVFRGLLGKIDPLVFRGGSSRFRGRHGAKNAVQVIDGREFVPFGLCCCLVPSCGQRRFILHRALKEGCVTLYGLYFYGRGAKIISIYIIHGQERFQHSQV